MSSLTPNKRGFTLIEVLLIVALLGIMGTAAISSYLDSTATFTFFERYQSVIASIRSARSDAVNIKQVYAKVGEDTVLTKPDYFGVSFVKNEKGFEIKVFADVGTKAFELDDGDTVERVVGISDPYSMEIENNKNQKLEWPLLLFYETETGNMLSYSKGNLLDYSGNKYLSIKFSDSKKLLEKYIVVFQVSGLAEEFLTDPKL